MEERIVELALRRGLCPAEAVSRARATAGPGGSLVQALLDLGALRPEAAHALLLEVQGGGDLRQSLGSDRFPAPGNPRASERFLTGPQASGAGPRASGAGPRASGAGPRASGAGPRASGAGPRASERLGKLGGDPRASDRRLPTLGEWELLAELGRGSNGVVYRARKRGQAQEVALKVFPEAARAGEEAIVRFRQEVDLARRLDHPAIVRVLEAGEAGPHAWYAMELCAGETLADRLRRGPLPAPEAAGLVAKLARAMAHAHERQVLHRDLKPANVILTPAGARITDLGLARDLARERSLTRTGDVLGTPLYMSPEQITGQRGLDGAIDVWALGVILFECLSGRRPFQAQDTLELAHKIIGQEPPLLRSAAPGAPPALEELVRRALARERDQRPSMAALAEGLEGWLASAAPGPAPGPRALPAGPAPSAARPRWVGAAAVGGLLLAAGLGAALVLALDTRRQRASDEALRDLAAAGPDDAEALERARQAVRGDPAGERRLAELEARRAAAAEEQAFQAALEQLDPRQSSALAALRRRAGDDPARVAALEAARRRALAACLERLEQQAARTAGAGSALRAELDLEQLLAEARALEELAGEGPASGDPSGDPGEPDLRDRLGLLAARHLYRRGRYAEALERAEGLARRRGAAGDLGGEAAWLAAGAAREEDEPERAQGLLQLLARAGSPPWDETARAALAMLAARSVADLQRVESGVAAILTAHPGFAPALEVRARALYALLTNQGQQERLGEVDRLYEELSQAAPDDLHPRHWRSLVKFQLRDLEGKIQLLGEAVALSEPRPHFRSLFWRAHTLFLRGRLHEALSDLERCLLLRPQDIEALLWRALCLDALGRSAEASAHWRRLTRERTAQVDAHLSGRGASVEVQPLAEAILQAHARAGGPALNARAGTGAPAPNPATRAALEAVTRRAAAFAPWEQLEPLLAAAEAAAADDPPSRQAVALARAWALYRRGRIEASREVAQALAAEAPGSRAALEARFVEAVGWLWGGDTQRGVTQLGELYQADPEGPVGLSAGATWNSYNGRNALGQLLARAALEQDPEALEPRTGLAFCLNDLGRPEQALEQLQRVLDRHPDHPRALMARAMSLTNLRRVDEALEALATVVRVTEPAPLARALTMQIQLGLGRDRSAARAAAERLVAVDPVGVEPAFWLALVLELEGESERARAHLRRAVERDPRLVEALMRRIQDRGLQERLLRLLR